MEFRRYTADQRRFRGGLKSVDRITENGSTMRTLDTCLLKPSGKVIRNGDGKRMNVGETDRKETRQLYILCNAGFEGFPGWPLRSLVQGEGNMCTLCDLVWRPA